VRLLLVADPHFSWKDLAVGWGAALGRCVRRSIWAKEHPTHRDVGAVDALLSAQFDIARRLGAWALSKLVEIDETGGDPPIELADALREMSRAMSDLGLDAPDRVVTMQKKAPTDRIDQLLAALSEKPPDLVEIDEVPE